MFGKGKTKRKKRTVYSPKKKTRTKTQKRKLGRSTINKR